MPDRLHDILLDFLSKLVDAYQRVFYVLGKHEFYGLGYEKAIVQARRLEKEPSPKGKLAQLHKIRWEPDDGSDNSTILGCTLWSQVASEARNVVVGRVKDYKHIEGWSVDKHCSLHQEEAVWLREQVAAIRQENVCTKSDSQSKPRPPRTIIIVTHHAPTMEGTSNPKHAADPWTSAFSAELILATEAVRSGIWQGVSAWVSDHTNYTNIFVCAGVRVVVNQRGHVSPSRPIGDAPEASAVVESDGAGEDSRHAFDPAMTIPCTLSLDGLLKYCELFP